MELNFDQFRRFQSSYSARRWCHCATSSFTPYLLFVLKLNREGLPSIPNISNESLSRDRHRRPAERHMDRKWRSCHGKATDASPESDKVLTFGHQSDAVVFVQSGPVGKAVHTTCTHNSTESCVQSEYQELLQLHVDGCYLGTPLTPGSPCSAAHTLTGF